MTKNNRRQQQAKVIRIFRKIHRTTGALLFFFFLFISITGLLLGWKKNSNGLILAKTEKGTSTELMDWLPLETLKQNAQKIFRDSISTELSPEIDRIDVRPDKGILKFKFVDNYYGIQLDGATGNLLKIERRRSDFIEQVHDGSILDRYLGTSDGQIKLFYTTVMGLALLVFTITGFWLWYGPKRMKRIAKNS
ncbi:MULTISPECIES: PepSY domain-containing protein [Maribacter]|uniref:PepSY domain-containing protein n=1 Tax=Maribacter flavus TaxID=1658664 RepID=A0A5B2U0M5_9FLAO|nr:MULTISPECIES: PepSY domain-containing protein [Maribacter]KAA2219530.1 PepSY domain-containing protein [Maribacter flavus]MDC6404477.1 PepSY domain-containing protein [Maribacter sp. PR66]MEE1971621.1 PepSY domain-containing protein [Maribacter flavus]